MMEKNRQTKVIAIVALVVAVVGMSLGFAAFSNILTISSSATVTPNEEDFKIVLSGDETDPNVTTIVPSYHRFGDNPTGTIEGDEATIVNGDGVSSTHLNVTFSEPGDTIRYDVYIHNVGNYTAYLNKLEFSNVDGTEYNKVCTPVGDTTPELVAAACESIEFWVSYKNTDTSSTVFKNTIEPSGISLDTGSVISGGLVIKYLDDGARADGPFTAEFGDVKFYFSTVD